VSRALADIVLEALAAIELNAPLDDQDAVRILEYLSFMIDSLDESEKALLLESSQRKAGEPDPDPARTRFFAQFGDDFGLNEGSP